MSSWETCSLSLDYARPASRIASSEIKQKWPGVRLLMKGASFLSSLLRSLVTTFASLVRKSALVAVRSLCGWA